MAEEITEEALVVKNCRGFFCYTDKFLEMLFCLQKEIYLAGVQRAQPFVRVEGAAPPSEMLGTDTSYWVLSVDNSKYLGEFENSFTRGEGGKTETK